MAEKYGFSVEGLDTLDELKSLGSAIVSNASRAINDTLDYARREAAYDIGQEINFPADYLSPQSGRLAVAERSNDATLEGTVVARHRATSLARFSATGFGSNPVVNVEVGAGYKEFKRAFFVHLNAGSSTETKSNLGIAIRLKAGEKIKNKKVAAIELDKNLYLLYGPSVDQAFRMFVDGDMKFKTSVLDHLEKEFFRLQGVFK